MFGAIDYKHKIPMLRNMTWIFILSNMLFSFLLIDANDHC